MIGVRRHCPAGERENYVPRRDIMRLSIQNSGLCMALAVILIAEAAQARQRSTRAQLNRPTANSAVTRFGRIGGTNTRTYSSPLGGAGRGTGGLARLPGFSSRGSFTRGRAARQLAQPGVGSGQNRTGAGFLGVGQVSVGGLRISSGMRQATSLRRPVLPYVFSAPPRGSSLYAMPPKKDLFHGYFDLRPAVEPQTPSDGTQASLIGNLQAGLKTRTDDLTARALRAFKEERYDAALAMFSGIRRLDRESHTPSLLAFHAALMLDRHALATAHLRVLIERHPEVFVEKESISQYFGDPSKYEDQLHALVRLSDDSPPGDLAIKSYCAWRLGDTTMARQAIERAVELSREERDETFIKLFSQAITPALN